MLNMMDNLEKMKEQAVLNLIARIIVDATLKEYYDNDE